jgi:hypothetical protein
VIALTPELIRLQACTLLGGGKQPSRLVCSHEQWLGFLHSIDIAEASNIYRLANGQLMYLSLSVEITNIPSDSFVLD